MFSAAFFLSDMKMRFFGGGGGGGRGGLRLAWGAEILEINFAEVSAREIAHKASPQKSSDVVQPAVATGR